MSFNDVSRGGPSSHHEKKQTSNSCIPPARKEKVNEYNESIFTHRQLTVKDSKRLIHESHP